MHNFDIIYEVVVILAVSLPMIYLFKKINVPSIIGFLIAGIVIGPYGLKLIAGTEEIAVMAEVGVILLLFTIGIEVSIKQLIEMKRLLLLAGGLQVILTIIFAFVIFLLLGIGFNKAIFFGMLVSGSSTTILLRVLSDRNELEAPHGRISLGISIFQDLAVVPMILTLPLLHDAGSSTIPYILLQLLIAFGSVAVIIVLAHFLMPKILFQLANLRIREAFTIGVILLLLGTAYLTHSIGLSFAIGAFIAGLILSESEFSPQIIAEMLPFKDAFNSIFFVSIGMLLNLGFLVEYPHIILVLVIGVVILKASVVVMIIRLMRFPLRTAVLSAFTVAQIGEFSFVLALEGSKFNLITPEVYNAFISTSIFTMMLVPFTLRLTPYLTFKSGKFETKTKAEESVNGLKNHVIIVGFGLNGKNLARVLKETGIKYIVLDLNPQTVSRGKKDGENIIFGDVAKDEILYHAKVDMANIIVFAISDPGSTKVALQIVKSINPNIYAIVRTRYTSEVNLLQKLGADVVIPEEFETSLQIFSKVLEKYHIPLNVIMKQVALLRGESYSMMLKDSSEPIPLSHLNEILAAGLTETFFVDDSNPIVGKTLAELHLRAKTGTTIIAIVRNNKTISNPSGADKILSSDTLVITGTHDSVDKAFDLLSGKNIDDNSI